jgi:hemerythrin-like metal-binding protein
MAYMDWSDNLSVGVDSVDKQHKKLVSMVNYMFDAMKSGKGRDILNKILDGLVDYTIVHFAYEEKLFAATDYSGAIEHKKQHDDLTKQVLAIQEKVKSGASFTLSMEVMEFLKNWLVNHIIGSDKKFGPHLVSKGIK